MSASLGLYRLQQVDRQIDRAGARMDAIRKTLDNDTELKSAQSRFASANEENMHALHLVRNVENEAQGLKVRIEQSESSLYGGSVRNPKELQDLQKDVAYLKKHLGDLEERQLEAMLQSEAAGTKMENAKAELDVVRARLGSEHQSLVEEQSELAKQLESLNLEREAALAPVETALLAEYENLRRQKRGTAVAEVEDGACASCGTTLNAALQQQARSQKLAHCPSCGRILFAN